MAYNEASQFSGYLGGSPGSQLPNPMMQSGESAFEQGQLPGAGQQRAKEKDTSFFHGEALARDFWAEHSGPGLC
ncbi:hypothetical protein [Dictyobacter kobayashii]|uniref:Uncharacterized protein n=1 Tax=Dictyobacter kobayashii TaxID=2014872 RepID=A0A402AWT0_9CHLR|nr:hypothetical protein [Dictyobacter kobayashii]GCE23548.1 hypothetical protein KDK_73480 [Dictyobacter kobayashii]